MIRQDTLYEIDDVRHISGFTYFCYCLEGGEINMPLVPPHWHNEMEIFYSEAGGVLYVNDESYVFEEGDIFFINPGQIHHTYRRTLGSMYHILFDLNLLKTPVHDNDFNDLIHDIMAQKRGFMVNPRRNSELYRDLLPTFKALASDSSHIIEYGYDSCRVLAQLYAIMAACYKADSFVYVDESSIYGMRYITEVMEYINQNYQNQLTIPLLSKAMNISETYLYRLFKNYVKLTPTHYINSVRMREAYRMLEAGKNVTETAVAVGIPNISYFIKLFKEATGQTPNNWLKNQRRNYEKSKEKI